MNEIEEEGPRRFYYPGASSSEPPRTTSADPQLSQRQSFTSISINDKAQISGLQRGGEERDNTGNPRSAPPPRTPHAFCAFRKRKCWYIIFLIIYIGVGVVTYVSMQADSDDNFAGTAPGDSSVANASYFIITALSTVGYGDLHPQSALAKGLVSAYVLIGLLLVAIVIVIIFRAFEDWEDHWIDRFVNKFLPRDLVVRAKKGITIRRRITGVFTTIGGWIKNNAGKLAETFKDKTVRMMFDAALNWLASLGDGVLKWYKKYYEGVQKGYRDELPNPTLPPTRSCGVILPSLQRLIATVARGFFTVLPSPQMWPHRWAEFIQESDRAEIKIIIAMLFSFLLTVLGAMVTNPYLAIMSVTTVGFGDESFSTPGTRIFAAVWLFPAFLVFGRVLSLVGDYLGSPDPCPSLESQ